MTDAFHDGAGAMIDGKLFVFGGGTVSGTDVVQAFDPASRLVAVVGHLPVSLSDLSAVTVGDTTYIVGGYDGHTPRREIYATTDGTSFRMVGRLPDGVRYPAVSAVGTTIVIAGGRAAHGPVDTVTAFDTVNGTSSSLGALPVPVAEASAVTIAGVVYLIGGRDASGDAVSEVVSIDPARGAIRRADPLRQPVADAGAVSGPNGALLIGGSRSSAVDQVLTASLGSDLPKTRTRPRRPRPRRRRPTLRSSDRSRDCCLIADRGNDRLLVMNAHKHIVWRYPSPDLPAPAVAVLLPRRRLLGPSGTCDPR